MSQPIDIPEPPTSSTGGSALNQRSRAPSLRRIPMLAVLLSAFPGAGNLYNGLYQRGIAFFAAATAAIFMTGEDGRWGLVVAFVWIFNVLDAWRQANLINLGVDNDLDTFDEQGLAPAGHGSLVAGALIFIIGLAAFLEIYFDIDMDWLADAWPILLMAVGAYFVWSSLRARARSESQSRPEPPDWSVGSET